MPHFDLPAPALLAAQAEWLAPARSRLLRRAQIATRRSVLDLGCAYGRVAAELRRRCAGRVVGLDHRREVLAEPDWPQGVRAVCAAAARLPFADGAFDLVFSQWTLVWVRRLAEALADVARVLQPAGHFLAIEPDFGAMLEHPPEIAARELWLAGLRRAGADPLVGRRLPGLLAAAGFEVRVDLLDQLERPSPLRLDLLAALPLSEEERSLLDGVRRADAATPAPAKLAHLPMLLVTARKPAAPG